MSKQAPAAPSADQAARIAELEAQLAAVKQRPEVDFSEAKAAAEKAGFKASEMVIGDRAAPMLRVDH